MKSQTSWLGLFSSLLLTFNHVSAINVNPASQVSLKRAMSQAAYDMMQIYIGNETGQTPGLLPYSDPQGYRYYWWEAGAMMGTLIDYWYYTGDTTYNKEVTQALLFQAGPDANYEPQNESLQLGNDDQAFWAFSAMMAAEYKFPNPPKDGPQWLELAQAVFNRQAERWDPSTCGGGLRWQIFEFNAGYDYKNSISNGCFMLLGARLARYTGNMTYAHWAEKEWTWLSEVGLITHDNDIWDGASTTQDCGAFNHYQWSYTYSVIIYALAMLYDVTKNSDYSDSANALLTKMIATFSKNGVIYEKTCVPVGKCNADQQSFPAYAGRFLSAASTVLPELADQVKTFMTTSASAAGAACTGGDSGTMCGLDWSGSSFDGKTGVGEQMSAIETWGSLIMLTKPGPITQNTGGISKGDPSAGTGESTDPPGYVTSTITTSDRAGAGIVTALIIVSLIGASVWMLA